MTDTSIGGDWEVSCLDLLENGATDVALRLALNNMSTLGEKSYTFMSGLFKIISKNNSVCYNTAVTILKFVATNCEVEDVVVDLIQICSDDLNVEQFGVVLQLYLILFNRESKRKDIFLDWCFSYLQQCLSKIHRKCDYLLAENFTKQFLSFVENIISIFSPLSIQVTPHICRALLLTIRNINSDSEKVFVAKLLLASSTNPFMLLSYCETSDNNSTSESQELKKGLALFFLMALTSDGILYPRVYSHKFSFLNLLPIFIEFLDDNSDAEVCKGLQLLEVFTPLLQNCFSINCLSPSIGQLLEKLNYTMVYCEERTIRVRALNVFEATIKLYDPKAQYHLFIHFRKCISHSGTLGLIISKIKDFFDSARRNPDDPYLAFFNGKRLFDVVKCYGYLTNGTATDIINNADQIVAALNFFWYLVRLAMRGDGIAFDFIPDLKVNYLKPLKSLIEDGLKNCEKELRRIKCGDCSVDSDVAVTVNNLSLPNISDDEQTKTVLCARNAIELMQINLNRILDLLGNNSC